jgi:hypothetical protein
MAKSYLLLARIPGAALRTRNPQCTQATSSAPLSPPHHSESSIQRGFFDIVVIQITSQLCEEDSFVTSVVCGDKMIIGTRREPRTCSKRRARRVLWQDTFWRQDSAVGRLGLHWAVDRGLVGGRFLHRDRARHQALPRVGR